MKIFKKSKIITLTMIVAILSFCFIGIFNKAEATTANKITKVGPYLFNASDGLRWYTLVAAGEETENDFKSENYPFIPTTITEEMISSKKAIPLYTYDESGNRIEANELNDNRIMPTDSTRILVSKNGKSYDWFFMAKNIASVLGVDENTIELQYVVNMPAAGTVAAQQSVVIKQKGGTITKGITAEEKARIDAYNKAIFLSNAYKDVATEYAGTEEMWNDTDSEIVREYTFLSAKAILEDGREYSLVIGANDKYVSNWVAVETKGKPEIKFDTELSYTAEISDIHKKVTGEIVNGTFVVGYDKENPEKDADVTATIKSITNLDILTVNGVALTNDGKPNSIGWYYADVNNKKEISKVYPFETYNNLKDNGMVTEKVTLGTVDGLTSEQTVSIKWPFRITKVVYDPIEITDETNKVTVTVTTNLPMDKDKLPEGWAFTTDAEGKSQHKIYKVYTRENGDVNKEIVVKENGRPDTDSTNVKITWPKKESLPDKIPQTGTGYFVLLIIAGVSVVAIVSYRLIKFNK